MRKNLPQTSYELTAYRGPDSPRQPAGSNDTNKKKEEDIQHEFGKSKL